MAHDVAIDDPKSATADLIERDYTLFRDGLDLPPWPGRPDRGSPAPAGGRYGLWHACTLHGTQADAADHERISLRYLFAKSASGQAGIDAVNGTLNGPLSLAATRRDLADDGSAAFKANSVNKTSTKRKGRPLEGGRPFHTR